MDKNNKKNKNSNKIFDDKMNKYDGYNTIDLESILKKFNIKDNKPNNSEISKRKPDPAPFIPFASNGMFDQETINLDLIKFYKFLEYQNSSREERRKTRPITLGDCFFTMSRKELSGYNVKFVKTIGVEDPQSRDCNTFEDGSKVLNYRFKYGKFETIFSFCLERVEDKKDPERYYYTLRLIPSKELCQQPQTIELEDHHDAKELTLMNVREL